MPVAFRSSLPVSTRRSLSIKRRWIRRLIGGLTAATIGFVSVAAAIATAGRVLAVSIDTRPETRSFVGLTRPSGGLAWFAVPDSGMITSVAADASPPNTARASAGVLPDEIYTGSLGKASSIFDPPDVALGARFKSPPRRDDARLLPLPRVRPQLASLTPPDVVTPDEDVPSPRTAIYDITAQAVYMPGGDKLEAHSGLGSFMDNPKHVHVKMRGATPPNTYKLTMREALFHGVQAIRMTPLDDSTMFRRNGILAHSYMLGPSGQSNGCISFKDYPKFLAAFKRGEVERIVVVSRLAKPPAFYARRNIKSAANTL